MMSAKLIDKSNNKHQQDLLRRIRELEGNDVEIGWFDGEQHSSGMTQATLAYVLEYGNDRGETGVNWEPFKFMTISALAGENDNRLNNILRKGVQKHLMNKSYVDDFMFDIGTHFQSVVSQVMGDPTKLRSNTEYTQELKDGKDSPTVEHGELKSNLKVKVRDKGGAIR